MDHNNILGTVLAGGKSQRFGEDKSQVKLGDKLLIDYILSEIIDEFNEVLVVSNNLINFKESEKITHPGINLHIVDMEASLALYPEVKTKPASLP